MLPARDTVMMMIVRSPSARRPRRRLVARHCGWLAAMTAVAALAAPLLAQQQPAAPAPAAAGTEPTLQQRLDRLCEQLERQRQALHIPGFALAIVKDDQVILSRGFGVRDVENNAPVTPETLFAVGSTSKAFTAALCATLVDEGKVAWDDPVTRHLPQFRLHDTAASEGMTLRDLLCHRSGLSRTDLLWASGEASRDEILAAIAAAEPTAKFREKFQYQNVMYLAAGMAAANAAGLNGDWDALVAQRIFQPLSMKNANTSISDAQQSPHLSLGYTWDKEKDQFKRLPMRRLDSIAPAGAINANVIDMAQWVRLQLNRGEVDGRRLITAERFDEMWHPEISLAGASEGAAGVSYGLGWMLQEWNGRQVVEHGGNIDGFGAQVSLLPDENIGYVLLTNVSHTPLQQMSIHLVFDALLGEWRDEATPALDPAIVQDLLGKYHFEMFKSDVTVLMKDGKLAVDVPTQMVYPLKPPDEHGKWHFELTQTIAISFERDAAGQVLWLTFHQNGLTMECLREGVTLPVEISLDEAQKYLGTYRDDEDDMNVTVLHRNGRLAIDVPKQTIYDLRPPDEQGVRWLRMNPLMGVKFEDGDDGRIAALVSIRPGGESRLPRVEEEPDNATPRLDDVLALRARGCGTQALASLGNVRITATLDMPNQGIRTARFNAIASGTDHFVQHIDMGKFGWMKTGLDGALGWSDSLFQGAEELPPEAVAATRFQHPLLAVFDWREAFDKIEIARLTTVNERPVVALELNAGESRCTAFVDRETGEVPRLEYALPIPGVTTVRTTQTLSDWRDVNGLRFPFRWEIENDLFGKTIIQVEKVETGVDLAADAFAMPVRK